MEKQKQQPQQPQKQQLPIKLAPISIPYKRPKKPSPPVFTLLEFFKKLFLKENETIYDLLKIKNILTYYTPQIDFLFFDDKEKQIQSIVKEFHFAIFKDSYKCDGELFTKHTLTDSEKKYNSDIKYKINTLFYFKAIIKDFFNLILSLKRLLTYDKPINSIFKIDDEDKQFVFSIQELSDYSRTKTIQSHDCQ